MAISPKCIWCGVAAGIAASVMLATLFPGCGSDLDPGSDSHAPPVARTAGIESPVRLAPSSTAGQLLVTDYAREQVFIVNAADLSMRGGFPVTGYPTAVATAAGRIFIGNDASASVEIYDPTGTKLGDLGGSPGGIILPSDIAVDETAGRIYVADAKAALVRVFDLSGAAVGTIPPVSTPSQLSAPTGVAVSNAAGELYVSDYGNPAAFPAIEPRIQVFSTSGAFLRSFSGKTGFSSYRFSRPQGLALDGSGRLYMVESVLGQIFVLDRTTGATIRTIGSFGDGDGQLMLPLDIHIDGATNDIFVTDNRNGRISVFRGAAS